MNRIAFICLFVLASLPALAQDEDYAAEWVVLEKPELHFRIRFPEAPSTTVDTAMADQTPVFIRRWQLSPSDTLDPNTFYEALAISYPPDYIHSDSSMTLLERIFNRSVSDLDQDEQYQGVSRELFERFGYPGKAFHIKYLKDNQSIYVWTLQVQNVYMSFTVVTKPNLNFNGVKDLFYDSLNLLDVEKGSYTAPVADFALKYGVTMPKGAESSYRFLDAGDQKIRQYRNTFESADGCAYVYSESLYPETRFDAKNAEALNQSYDNAVDNTSRNMNIRLSALGPVKVAGFTGREVRGASRNGDYKVVMRLLMEGDRQMTWLVVIPSGKEEPKDLNKFLGSLARIKP